MPLPPDPSEQSGKSRAQRIRLDYFRQHHWLRTWRWIATAGAVLGAAGYLAWVSLVPGGVAHLSTGEISAAHAAFDQNCSQCHSDFVPIAVDAWRPQPAEAIDQAAAKCRHCHATIEPHSLVFSSAGKQSDQHCALCHSEHQGRNHQLIPATDDTCVDCHRDVTPFHDASSLGGQPKLARVTRFSNQEHGEFRSLVSDDSVRSRIAFDHALHMQPGQVAPGRRGGMKLDRIAAEHRGRYQRPGDSDNALIQLQCADCHQFQDASAGRVRSGDFDWGRGSLPVRYEQHCIACHPLTLPGQRDGQLGLAHGRSLLALQDSIRGHLAALASDSNAPFVPANDELPIRIPGEREEGLDSGTTTNAIASDAAAMTNAVPALQLQRVLGNVRRQCQLCHTDIDLDAMVRLPRLPQPRLRAGWFDHGAHRTMACLACHPGADPNRQSVASELKSVLSLWQQRLDLPRDLPGQVTRPLERDGTSRELTDSGSSSGALQLPEMTVGIAACTPCHQGLAENALAVGERSGIEELAILFGGLSTRAPARCTTCHQYHGDQIGGRLASPSSAAVAHRLDAPRLPPASSNRSAKAAHQLISTLVSAIPLVAENANVKSSADTTVGSAAVHRHSGVAMNETPGRWLGNASCATSTCHGGPIRDRADWNSSQSIFEVYDPHARAALVLATPESRQMITLLDPATAQSPERFEQVMRTRCNGCHLPGQADGVERDLRLDALQLVMPSTGRTEQVSASPQVSQLLEGVSCEACHGPASGWLQAHLSDDWTIENGMRENRNYIARLEGCVRCHVGSRREDGVIRDVNHDLIAAGHPALRFEPWSALRRLPQHGNWQRSADGLPEIDGEAHLRRFLVGRAVALRAAVRLTAERLDDATTNLPRTVWPELAEYDCFACHHSLKITNLADRPSPGHPASNPWLISGFIADGLKQVAADDAKSLIAEWNKFRLVAAGGIELVPAVRKIEAILDQYLERLSDPRKLPASVVAWRRLDELQQTGPLADPQTGQVPGGGWYDAAYWYLRFHVSVRDRDLVQDGARVQPDAASQNRALNHREIAQQLKQLADALQFDSGPRDDRVRMDSPEQFELSTFRRLSERLADMVESN